ncbi:Poly [ADP-ribose] polymerase 14 [Bagarius yarrelli]|uniref:Poly [ADP-ribose] polymerase n=1 Tax=Bagarius yarrelli TaxID=175774 RepID=A0A556U652_BAGYA|nr:Poly [ADP-ribose] polymerase 14 [Bagarius yarrelli]
MSDFQYAVLFEANGLSDEDIKKIRNYFKIKRQSGGGECGEVEKVKDNTYKINFLEEAAQDRVLRKKDHIISLSGKDVQILIKRQDNEEEQLLPHSTSKKQVGSKDMPIQKVFKLHPYLLHFLKDNLSAKSYLDEQLSGFLSSFKVDLVTETVVVVRDAAQMGQNDVLQKWEEKMDIVFSNLQSRYIIHFETDPIRLKLLQKKSLLLTKNVEIFEENGLAVIVGEPKEVNRFLNDVDAFHLRQQACKECPVSDMHYALVKEQFEQEMKSKYSNIEITREQPGCLVLKGPKEQVNLAATKFKELLNLIQEKKIAVPYSLQVFLSSSSAIKIFQTRFRENLCSPVLIEPTSSGSDLVLLSLSAGALQEAAHTIQRDLCVETVVLEKYEAESSSVDALNKALNPILQQANQETSKVELSYKPGTGSDNTMKVQLTGFNTEVNQLKNIIQDHKQNYAQYCDSVSLPLAELVDHFSELLTLLDVTATDVKLTATVLPVPCVSITGPRCRVTDMKNILQSSFSHLIWEKTSVDGPGVLKFFKEDGLDTQRLLQSSCNVLISLKDNFQTSALPARRHSFTSLPNIAASMSHQGYSLALEIVFGGLEDQQTDVLVAPMLNANLTSTNVGKALLNKAGQQLRNNFNAAKRGSTIMPGNVLEVDGTSLGCKKVFFIECVPWTENIHNSEKVLRCGLEQALTLCEQQLWSSVAFSVIGPGLTLAVPVQNATNILVGEIGNFGLAASTCSLRKIKIVIMPNNPDSEEIHLAVSTGLTSIMVDHTGQPVFQSLSSEIDEIAIPLTRCQVQLIYGDISDETTDVIVNTTDFANLGTDVCNDILTIAGPQVRAALTGANVNKGEIFVTQPGDFHCKAIMHVCGAKDTNIIKTLARDILLKCEHSGYKSVAIPAICAGKGGLSARLVAEAILQGVKDATVQANFNNLKRIHIVLIKIHVFLHFKAVTQSIFGNFTQNTAPLFLTPLRAAPSSLSLDLSSRFLSLPDQHSKAEFLIVGITNDNVSKACQELHQAYQRHCSSHFVSQEETKHLTEADMDDIINNVTSLEIQISQQGPNGLKVTGLTKGINEFMQLIRGALVRKVKEKEQDVLFSRVSWCISGLGGAWERLPKEAHHQLENGDIAGGIVDAKAQKWTVNLNTMEATAIGSVTVAKLKRQENLSNSFYPLYWDSMTTGESLKVVPLDPSSAEYKRVKSSFKRTASKAVLKIERIQNLNLRQAYEVRKKELQHKHAAIGARERVLYHGTTAKAAVSIQSSNFNRRTIFGHGTYFAVDASYSANPAYSPLSNDGTQLMFVSLVLTGHYTKGSGDMKVPPPRSSQDPNDRFDSLVDNIQNPSIFVVFHDCQAYPDYVITFK